MNCHDTHTEDPVEYDQYTLCLSKALCYMATPVTVGLYAPWGSGMENLQQNIERCLVRKAAAIERQDSESGEGERPRSATTAWGLLALVSRLLFFSPVLTRRRRRQRRERRAVRFVFVPFNAWEFAGSDLLWAGLVTALCEAVRLHFGTLPTGVYRATCGRAALASRRGGDSDSSADWEAKRLLCVPLWVVALLLVAALAALVGTGVAYGFPDDVGVPAAVEGLLAGALGLSAAAALRDAPAVAWKLLVSQKAEVERIMNKTSLSDQLGFMYRVKREVEVVTNFVRCVEVFERRRIRVVLQLSNLDRCAPDKVVSVLEAMNILLSDKHARFVSLLGVDPRVVNGAVERVYPKLERPSDGGYQLLNRTVDLPFTVPGMDRQMKLRFVKAFVEGMDCVVDDDEDDFAAAAAQAAAAAAAEATLGSVEPVESLLPRVGSSGFPMQRQMMMGPAPPPTAGQLVRDALEVLKSGKGDILDYVEHNLVNMRRIVNTLPVIVRLVVAKHGGLGPSLTARKLVAWTVLSTQWPCRLSWTLQCGSAERSSSPGGGPARELVYAEDASLWDVYESSLREFRALMKYLDSFIDLDGDSEQFERFLKRDHLFTVKEAAMLRPLTVNLDRSIQSEMERLRGKYRIRNFDRRQGSGREAVAASRLLDMTPQEVCAEVRHADKRGSRCGPVSPDRLLVYQARVEEQGLSGRAILASAEEEEVRGALATEPLGDWALFRDHFLGTPQLSPDGVEATRRRAERAAERRSA